MHEGGESDGFDEPHLREADDYAGHQAVSEERRQADADSVPPTTPLFPQMNRQESQEA